MLAFAYSFWMIYGAGQEYIAQGFLLLMAGIPVYVYIKWRQAEDDGRDPAGRSRRSRPTASTVRCAEAGGAGPCHRVPTSRWPPDGRPRAAFGVHSEAGSCVRVLVHRPGLELERLTPRNKDDLLFDDVIWVKRARQEHDAFVDALAERGVEVLEVRQPAGRDARRRRRAAEVLDGTIAAAGLGPRLGPALREWLAGLPVGRARGAPDRRRRVRRAALRRRRR